MVSNEFLFDILKKQDEFFSNVTNLNLDDFFLENLSEKFQLRYYQEEAFKYFKCYFETDNLRNNTNSVLFNMATGSGKTFIMAGLILYLFSKGYNNFLFFVNSNTVINKTKDNFLNFDSDKYLFSKKININDKNVSINAVDTFEGVSNDDINICFTTIQKLHSDLNINKENSLTFDDFKNKKIVLIADEAHHIQANTKSEKEKEKTWEDTINHLLNINSQNLLLEFTATVGIENNINVREKYIDKLLYKYDLKQYVYDKYSKTIEIIKVDDTKENLMLTAVLINQYRQDIAYKHSINNFKPVILFKTNGTIKESENNRKEFEYLIENLNAEQILYIKNNTNNSIFNDLFNFYEDNNISIPNLVKKIKLNFNKRHILDVNKDEDIENYQLILNNLESKNNPFRIIFAVQKLNEGWDVLNLFDIVRLSNKKGNPKKLSKSTISEAQLIGRGARYYPFNIPSKDNENYDYYSKFKRKFDDDLNNELRILEELYFYSFDDSAYIAELHNALSKEGLTEDMFVKKELKLKESFKKTDFYKSGVIYKNFLKKSKNYFNSTSLNSFKEKDLIFKFKLSSGSSSKIDIFEFDENEVSTHDKSIELKLSDIDFHIIRSAISKNKFYDFNNLKKYFNALQSTRSFIKDEEFLGSVRVIITGNVPINSISNKLKLDIVSKVLKELESIIKNNSKKYIGSTEFKEEYIKDIFIDKLLILNKDSDRLNNDGDIKFLDDKEWYVFNANYGTSEERAFVDLINNLIDKLREKFSEVYLIRNELHFYIYDFKEGRTFSPDFVLFLKDKEEDNILNFQLFIEPKGTHLIEHDKWKENFLKDISIKKYLNKLDETEKYIIYGLPFYNSSNELEFKENLINILEFKSSANNG